MNFILHDQKQPQFVKDIPKGLTELMSDISREVLRNSSSKTSCTYEFICNYLESLIAAREKITVVRRLIDDIIDMSYHITGSLHQSGISLDKANEASDIIQENFRNYITDREMHKSKDSTEFNESDIIQELITKCNFTKNDILKSTPTIRNAFKQFVMEYTRILKGALYEDKIFEDSVERTLNAYWNFSPDLKKLNYAAIKIQAAYRGYYTRKILKAKKQKHDSSISPIILFKCNRAAKIIQRAFRKHLLEKQQQQSKTGSKESLENEIKSKAAVKIQAAFRGYIVRKTIKSSDFFSRNSKHDAASKDLVSYIKKLKKNPEANKAATKIQALFRGHNLRKTLHEKIFQDQIKGFKKKFEKQQNDGEELSLSSRYSTNSEGTRSAKNVQKASTNPNPEDQKEILVAEEDDDESSYKEDTKYKENILMMEDSDEDDEFNFFF